MKTKKLRHLLTATAVLFSMMLALPRQTQAQNTVTIDGVKKNILSTEFLGGDGDADAFAAYLYLSSDKKEYVRIMGNQKLHATYETIDLSSYEPRHDGQWYWSVDYTKNGYGHELFNSYANPTESYSLFSSGELRITGYPKPPRNVCGIYLYNGKITDSKHGDGNVHTISIDYKYERTKPTAGTITVDNVTDSAISLSWTHGNDNTTPQESLFYEVFIAKKDVDWTKRGVGNATSYTISGLEPNTIYWLVVRVLDESGNYIHYAQVAVTTKPITYDLKICGVPVTLANCGNLSVIPGVSGTVKYNPTTRTLTLQNATITSPTNYGILSEIENLKIIVTGTCNVAVTSGCPALSLEKPSSITGTGTLNATAEISCGIYFNKTKLTIDGCTVKAVGRWGITGNNGSVEELTIRKANVTAEGAANGSIRDIKTLTLDGCVITQPADAAFSEELHCVALGGELVRSKVVIKPVITYGLKICDVPVTSANCDNLSVIPGVSGIVKYNPTTRTLTLQNATITSSSKSGGIYSNIENLEIKVTGTCSVASTGNAALSLKKPSTITGSGTLNTTSLDNCGIYLGSKLTIDGCTVKAVGRWGIVGEDGSVEELTIRNANVTAEGAANGSIRDIKTLTLDGCAITQPAGAAFNASLHGVALGGAIVKSKVVIKPITYDLKICDVPVTSANCGNLSVIPGVSGTVMYNPTTRTLTLQNATITSSVYANSGIVSKIENLKIIVTGTCSVAATGGAALGLGSPSSITGTGTLNATSKNLCGIYFQNTKLTIDGCTVKAVGKWGIVGNDGSVEELTIRNANVTAEGAANGSLRDIKTLTLDGCAITQPAGAAFSEELHGVALGGELVRSKVVITKGATGIASPSVDVPAKHRGIYTLQGVKMQGDFDSLPAGIYIIDGRKVVKK